MSVNKTGKRVAVIGSRDFDDKQKMYSVLSPHLAKIKLIVSGGARGADTLATNWAADFGVPYLVFPALWHDPVTGEYDRGAGFRRNRDIVEHSDVIIAFWDGKSKGTNHSIQMAQEMGKTVRIVPFTPPPPTPGQAIAEAGKESPKKETEEETDRQSAIEENKDERTLAEATKKLADLYANLESDAYNQGDASLFLQQVEEAEETIKQLEAKLAGKSAEIPQVLQQEPQPSEHPLVKVTSLDDLPDTL
jgi:predicted Rossmann fold nucleotide-binding protein DprA/Smf involved in DNA uptake